MATSFAILPVTHQLAQRSKGLESLERGHVVVLDQIVGDLDALVQRVLVIELVGSDKLLVDILGVFGRFWNGWLHDAMNLMLMRWRWGFIERRVELKARSAK